MAVVFIEGWDHFNPTTQSVSKGWSGNPNQVAAGVLGGQYAGDGASGGGQTAKTLAATYAEIVLGSRLLVTVNGTTANNLLLVRVVGGTYILRVGVDVSDHYRLCNSAGATLATGTVIRSNSRWDYVEMRCKINGASGIAELRVNGTVDIPAFTVNLGSALIDGVGFGFVNGQSTRVDDMYATDTTGAAPQNGYLGDCRVEAIYPTAEGNSSAWTPVSGTDNALMVDDPTTVDNDSTYVSTGTVNAVDTNVMNDLSTASGSVFGIKTVVWARKTDAGSRSIADVIRHSGTDYAGTSKPQAVSYAASEEYRQQNPLSADWSIASVNALEMGYKLTV